MEAGSFATATPQNPLNEILAETELVGLNTYRRPAIEVARALLGTVLILPPCAGRIVEVEAYLGEKDEAAHAFRGLTPRTKVLYGPPGHAYVYFIYGMHDCLNVVAEPTGSPGCVLIRALEPLAGLDVMYTRRAAARRDRQLASGPGKLTRAMGIGRELNGSSLISGPLTIRRYPNPKLESIMISPRIGITRGADWPLRFYFEANPHVSG